MRLTTAAAGAASLLLAAGLAACSGDPEPGSPLPTGEPAPGATTSAPPTSGSPAPTTTAPGEEPLAAPTLPPEATTNDAAGAEAFVRYWFALSDYSLATGDTGQMSAASDESCGPCAETVDLIVQRYDEGGSFEGGLSEVTEVVAPAPDASGVTIASFRLTQEPVRALDAAGEQEGEPVRADPRLLQMVLRWTGDAWRVDDIGV